MKPTVHILPASSVPQETMSPFGVSVLIQAATVRGAVPVTPLKPLMSSPPSFPSNFRALPTRPGTDRAANVRPPSSWPTCPLEDASAAGVPLVSVELPPADERGVGVEITGQAGPTGKQDQNGRKDHPRRKPLHRPTPLRAALVHRFKASHAGTSVPHTRGKSMTAAEFDV